MEIRQIMENKKQFLPLLLLGDEQENMIDRYLARGTLYVLLDPEPRAVCVVTDEGGGVLELKNLAVAPAWQRHGCGHTLIEFLCERYAGKFHTLQLGTGETPGTLSFYRKCGFSEFRRVPDFFTQNYDHPIIEEGVLLRDMIYLHRNL